MSKKNNQYPQEGIAIIGLGCYYPKSNGVDQFWNNIINKVDCITEIPKGRWDPDVYYSPDKNAPDKTYSKIGGFLDPFDFSILSKKYKIPPKVIGAMDFAQKFALLAAGDALEDAGYANKDFDRSRTAVIIGNSMGGDKSDYSDFRVFLGDVEYSLKNSPAFSRIDPATQKKIIEESVYKLKSGILDITEDTMPGELSNVIAGRISNALNLTGQSIAVDAACASSIASFQEAARGLRCGDFDMVVAGGSDFMMGPSPYIKFSKIGAISPDGSRPFDAGANGFVMGEGSGIFILKRVSDARRDGDKIYAILAGIGASADGKGKGITAPNPKGQTLAISRAFKAAGYTPETVQYVEAHGTSTVVGDLAEMEGLLSVWGNNGIKNNSIGIGSIKSNIGHLKAASGSAAIIKLALSLYKKIMPPSINYKTPNPNIAFGKIPLRVVTDVVEWPAGIDGNPRRGNASAFGFGGTNFHAAFEEDTGDNGMPLPKKFYSGAEFTQKDSPQVMKESENANLVSSNSIASVCDYTDKRYEMSGENNKKLEGEAIIIGGSSWNDINDKLAKLKQEISGNRIGLRDLARRFNNESNSMDYRLGIAAFSVDEFIGKFKSVPEGFDNLKRRMVLKNKGLFYGEHLLEKKKSPGKICFMFPGQGTQYVNMLKDLYNKYKVVKDSFDEADRVMYEIMGKGITEIFFQNDDASESELAAAEDFLRPTEITQPGVLTADYAMFRLLRSFGVIPDVVVGHSLGEYGALIASGVMSFKDALHAVAARGKEVANIKWNDVGKMLSIPAPAEKVEQLLNGIPGYAIIANKNCNSQTVVGGESVAVNMVFERCGKEGIPAQEIPVSHAFHTKILEPAGESFKKTLEKFSINSPKIDIVANLNGDYYPKGENVRGQIIDILVKHISNPVEFIKQVERMYADGVTVFIEAGPKRTLSSFVLNILDKRPHLAMATNHPKRGGIGAFNDAIAAMSTQGFDIDWNGIDELGNKQNDPDWRLRDKFLGKPEIIVTASTATITERKIELKGIDMSNNEKKKYPLQYNTNDLNSASIDKFYGDFQSRQRKLVEDVLDIYSKKSEELLMDQLNDALYYKTQVEKYNIHFDKVMISGVSLGLPGQRFKVFDDNGFDRLAEGVNMIDPVPNNAREHIAEKNIRRLLKKSDGEASFVTITDKEDVVKLVGRKGEFNFQKDYGFEQEYADKLEITTQLAIAAGIEALKDAGIPLVMNYKRTSTNKLLPAYWALPEDMQDDTGIIFAAAFPGENSVIDELNKALAYKYGTKTKKELIKLYTSIIEKIKDEKVRELLTEWYAENYSLLKDGLEEDIYKFNSKFIFKILVMGHSQFAELIKAKGPNIHVNAACSSTTVGVGIAEDWIRTGRAKRVVVVAADDVTTDAFIEWILSGFLAVGAVTTQGKVEDAAIPFDKRRNGFIVGMGAAGIVIEAESEIKKRGMEPIVEVVTTEFLNSAFHGTKIDNDHVSMVMQKAVSKAENRLNVNRSEMAKDMLFMSHETYTPARGGSASSEVKALKETFKEHYQDVLVSNTKGFTGHTMAVGVEDVVAVRCLQTGKIPPIANFKEIDPELGMINLCTGGKHENIKYALRLGAGFGSQIAVSVLKLVSRKEDRVIEKGIYAEWLKQMSGIENPELEIVNRTLRVKDDGSIMKKDRAGLIKAASIESPAIDDVIAVRFADGTSAPGTQLPPAVPQSGVSDESIKQKIMKIVGEKTGYPEDLIEFDLDMESDLGIDTVKQAEMFGMIREVFNIPIDENIRIKDFPTLNHIIGFIKAKSPEYTGTASAPPASAMAVSASAYAVSTKPLQTQPAYASASPVAGLPVSELDEIRKQIMKIVGEKTGYPEDLIEFDLDMESDLGIDTVKQAEMFGMIRDAFNIPAEEGIRIKDFPTLNHVIGFVTSKSPKYSHLGIAPLVAAQASSPAGAAPASPSAAVQQPQAASAPGINFVGAHAGEIDEIRRKIVKIVEEKTGYPEDLIEFDLDMESDLGIDTVKQAEMFGMIRETFSIPADETIRIKDFPTLNHVIGFVTSKSPDFSQAKPVARAEIQHAEKAEALKNAKSNIKRMTVEMIEEPLNKKAEPRFNFKGMNVLITDDGKGIAKAIEKSLVESEAKVGIISQSEMESTDQLNEAIERVKKAGKINGIIHLTSMEESKSLDEMSFEDWRKNVFKRVKAFFYISKTLQKDIIENANSAFIVSVTDMGGTFGIEDFTSNNPIAGGVSGLAKGLDKEFNSTKKQVLVKAIDMNASEKPAGIAKTILNEIQSGNKKVEVGYAGKTRMVTQVIYKDIDLDAEPRKVVGEGSVFVVTGGGYGITNAISKDIAKNLKAKFALISLESLPSNIEELAKLDANGLKQLKDKIVNELKSKNERVTPVMIDKEYAKYTIAIDIYNNIEEMKKLGAPEVEYYSCNVMDHKAMTETIDKIRARFGRIDAVIHGAGINKDKFLEDKTFEDFSLVVDVKADGCFNIMEAVKNDGVKVLVTFASISGRFGNIGQTDYSSANDLLNKYVEYANRRFAPDMKAVSMNWSGWLGVGMATRGSIAKIFEESGVDMIPMEEGITKVREEILYGNDAEIIVAGGVGGIDSDKIIVGYKTKEFTALSDRLKGKDKYPLIDEIVSIKPGKMIVVKKVLNTENDLYLQDHSIDGVPYFPAVMGIETFAETVSLLFPGTKIKLMKDIKFNIPVKILKGKPVNMIITAERVETQGNEITLKTKLDSEFFKDGVKLGANKLHFEAIVIVSDKGADKKKLKSNGVNMEIIQNAKNGERIINDKEIYKRFFHGPKFQVHGGVINIDGKMIYGELSGKNRKGDDHFSFVKKPDFLSNPMAIEAAFQNAGMYAMKKENKMALPDGIDELVFVQIPSNVKDLYMSAKHIKSDELKHEYDTVILDGTGNVYSVMKGYKMINIGDLKENEKF